MVFLQPLNYYSKQIIINILVYAKYADWPAGIGGHEGTADC
jgi:hypothetical protein